MVVERREDVLGVAPVDAVAVAVEDVGVDEVRIRVDGPVVGIPAATDADQLVTARRG